MVKRHRSSATTSSVEISQFQYPLPPPVRHVERSIALPALLSGITSLDTRRPLPRRGLASKGATDAEIRIARACIKPQLTALLGHVAD